METFSITRFACGTIYLDDEAVIDKDSEESTATKRTYKDSVFTGWLTEEPTKLIEVYNAVTGSHYPLDTNIEIKTIKNALVRSKLNDIAFLLDKMCVQ